MDTPTSHGVETPGVGLANSSQGYGTAIHLQDNYLLHGVMDQSYPQGIPSRMSEETRVGQLGPHTEEESLWSGSVGQHPSDEVIRNGNTGPRPGEESLMVGNIMNMAQRTSDEGMRTSTLGARPGEENIRVGNMGLHSTCEDSIRVEGHGGQRPTIHSPRHGNMLLSGHPVTQRNAPMHFYMEDGNGSMSSSISQQNPTGLTSHNDMSSIPTGPKGATLLSGPHDNMVGGSVARGGPLPQQAPDLTHRHPQHTAAGSKSEGVEVERGDDGSLKSATKDYTERNLPRELMGKMFGLLKEGMFCDAVILAGNKEIRVHKMVLIAASPFLLSKLSKTTPSTSLRVELPMGIPLQVASQLVHYLYDGKITLTTDNVSQFARVANLFKLEHLYNICEDFIDCFNLDESLLNVMEEDISVSATEPRTSPIALKKRHLKLNAEENMAEAEVTENTENTETNMVCHEKSAPLPIQPKPVCTTKGKTANKKAPKKSTKLKQEEVSPQMETPVHKVSHLYGTRAASAAKVTKQVTEVVDETGAATSYGKHGFYQTEVAEVAHREIGDSSPTKHPSPVKHADLINKTPELDNDIENNENGEEEDDETSDDSDEDYLENSATGKFKQLKQANNSLKKLQSKKRQKKMPVPPAPKQDMPLRPPPKKRAREFAKSEEDKILQDIESKLDLSVLDVSVSLATELTTKKKAVTKKIKKKRKKHSFGTMLKSVVTSAIAELDKNAELIPESERQFKCKLCGNEFVFPKRSITHLINTHEISPDDVLSYITIRKFEKSPRVCDICGYETKEPNFYYIHYHKYFRHGIPLPKGWKPFTCDICGKECFTKFQLKDHKLIHREQTPFICEKCGQGFKSRTCLNSHVFHRHNSIRKHDCTECEKSFKTKTQLMVHHRIHTGEKPFHCPDCDYKSTTRGNMRLHLTNKHKYDSQVITCMMYQIKTLSKAYEMQSLPQDLINNANLQTEESDLLNTADKNQMRPMEDHVGMHLPTNVMDNDKSPQPSQRDNDTFSNLGNILVANPQGQPSQLIYTDENITNRHIILQSYNGQQIVTGELQRGQTSGGVECQDTQATQIPVLLQPVQGTDHLAGHFLVQTHHGGQSTVQLLSTTDGQLTQDPRGQEAHILVQDSQGMLQEAGITSEQVLITDQEQLNLSSSRRQSHEQQIMYVERPANEMVQQDQLILATDKNVTVHESTGHSTTELQNVSPRLMIDGNQQVHIQIHTGTAVTLETDSHGQVQERQVRIQDPQGLLVGERPQVTLVHRGLNIQDRAKDTVQPKQEVQISVSTSLESYQQVSLPVTSENPLTTYVVNSQNTGTSIESQGQLVQSPPNTHGLPTTQAHGLPDSPTTQSSQSYSDNTLYQYYHQQFNNF
ncbi:uncharacterized protein LOC110466600 [Mizuhopecten yessoensis]|uniref:Zinc finger protein 407 n=1 Tax=Mizuhopecten yessoensis TaxID=6573 RepID=A0A210R1S1_MIZYE|nr:uncharacterized protein LOC110466600 [Mizuhopecten yessoensis]OWF54894.1 Zinc finger protein 407 [Mizuhopecten yessoensis]